MAANIKVVYVEVVPPGTPGDLNSFDDIDGNQHQVKETVLLDPENNIDKSSIPSDGTGIMSAKDRNLADAYNLLKQGTLSDKLKDRMQHTDENLTVYLVDDSVLTNYDQFWPHANANEAAIKIGANAITNGPCPALKGLLAHEVTHHIDKTEFEGYDPFPMNKGYKHNGSEIYSSENPAWVEGIAEYYQLLEAPNSLNYVLGSPPVKYSYYENGKVIKKVPANKSDLWKNETINAFLLHDIGEGCKDGHKRIDKIFNALNQISGAQSLKSFLKTYLATYPDDVFVVAEAIEKYIGAGQVAEVLSEEQMRKVESKTIAEADAGELRKMKLQKIEELNKCQDSLNALREERDNRSTWNYIFTFKWIYDPLSSEIEDMENKIKGYENVIAELDGKIKEYDLDLIRNIKVEVLGITEKARAPISAPDLTTTSVGEQVTGASETSTGKATVNSSEW